MIVETVGLEGPEPVSLEEAKMHLRVIGAEEDALIEAIISAARAEAELVSRRALVPKRLRLFFPAFPQDGGWLMLRPGPVVTVEQVRYVTPEGTAVDLDHTALVLSSGLRACLGPGTLKVWPATRSGGSAVTVEMVSGYEGVDLPPHLKQAMLLLIGDYYENRERSVVAAGVSTAINPAARNLLMMDRYT